MNSKRPENPEINPAYKDLENPEGFASVDFIEEFEEDEPKQLEEQSIEAQPAPKRGSAENVNSEPEVGVKRPCADQPDTEKDVNSTELGIHMISVYQSVTFEKSKHSLFYTDSIMPRKYPNVKLTVRGDLGMVEIESKTDHILIPYANVSCVYMQTEARLKELKEFKENNKSKHVHTESDIKRPR